MFYVDPLGLAGDAADRVYLVSIPLWDRRAVRHGGVSTFSSRSSSAAGLRLRRSTVVLFAEAIGRFSGTIPEQSPVSLGAGCVLDWLFGTVLLFAVTALVTGQLRQNYHADRHAFPDAGYRRWVMRGHRRAAGLTGTLRVSWARGSQRRGAGDCFVVAAGLSPETSDRGDFSFGRPQALPLRSAMNCDHLWVFTLPARLHLFGLVMKAGSAISPRSPSIPSVPENRVIPPVPPSTKRR